MSKRVIIIDETDTNKTCSFCGIKKKVMRLSERIRHRELCGAVFDRDKNAAFNILKQFLSQHALWTSYHHFLYLLGNGSNLRQKRGDKAKNFPYCYPSVQGSGNGIRGLVGSRLL